MKIQKRFVCKECTFVSTSWLGKCPECNSWGSLIEEIVETPSSLKKKINNHKAIHPIKIQEIQSMEADAIKFKNEELNIFYGDGLVKGSVILLAGEPGIGKSTFLFYMSDSLSSNENVYYFSGEESVNQIKKRFDRVAENESSVFVSNIANVEQIVDICYKEKPKVIFIDSIQTLFSKQIDSSPGTISQIKKCTLDLVEHAKTTDTVCVIVCHVTKSGDIAGPKIMEHMVDVVLYFESDFKNLYRVLRSRKNRFGGIDEVLFFEMNANGLTQITNASTFFLEESTAQEETGKCKSVIIEGRIPVIIDVEALVIPSSYPNPRRITEGIDSSRLNRIVAILDKHLKENFSNYDIYLTIAGGVRTDDVSVDLAIAASIYSSKNKIIIKPDMVFLGELSLTGYIKKVAKQETRHKEAKKFGFSQVISKDNENSAISHIGILKEILQ